MNALRTGCDVISELPDCLLTHILSYIPTKDSVKTSVLSKRWEFLWLKVSALDLNVVDDFLPYGDGNFSALVGFMERFLEFNRGTCLKKFKINYHRFSEKEFCYYPLMEWIDEVVNRGVRYLDVENKVGPRCVDIMPKNVFVSKTLVSLKLVMVALEGFQDPNFVVSLPCLKILHLEDNYYTDDSGFSIMAYENGYGPLITEKLITGSPLLEDITLEFHNSGDPNQVNSFSTDVPQCLSSTLKYVKLNKRIMETELKLLKYFLENSAVLKKLTLCCTSTYFHNRNQERETFKKLFASTKLSPRCKICTYCCH